MFKVLVSTEEARQTIAAQLDDIATLVKVSKQGRPSCFELYGHTTSSLLKGGLDHSYAHLALCVCGVYCVV